jgi:RNA polymerase sigma-70 factor (ECF subfamily)
MARDGIPPEVVDRSVRGDTLALQALLRVLAPRLRRVIHRRLGPNNHEADDCLQEALVAVSAALPSFRGESTLLTFATRIAARCAVSTRRRVHLDERRCERAFQLLEPLCPIEMLPPDAALRAQQNAAVRALLASLPETQASAFAMRVVAERSIKEVARATGVPVNTVRSRVRMARNT